MLEWERGRFVKVFVFRRAAREARFEVGFVVPVGGLFGALALGVVEAKVGSRISGWGVGNAGVWLRAKGERW